MNSLTLLRRLFAFSAAAIFFSNPAVVAHADDGVERAVLAEINFARTAPERYAELLASQRGYYHDGNLLSRPGESTVRTREGVAALDSAIRALQHTRALPPLGWSHGLNRSALDHARDQAARGGYGHRGSDGSSPSLRMNRHGRWVARSGEAIDYGNATARRIVMNLLIDDGVRDRGHRWNLLDPSFAVAGIGCASHPTYRRLCVIDFANAYLEPGADAVAMVGNTGPSLTNPMVSRATGLAPLPRSGRF